MKVDREYANYLIVIIEAVEHQEVDEHQAMKEKCNFKNRKTTNNDTPPRYL